MIFKPCLELSPCYEEGIFEDFNGIPKIATNFSLRDGNTLYLMGGTILCKYNISNKQSPILLKKTDIVADHTGDSAMELLCKGCAHATAMVDLGQYLAISLRNSGGGIAGMEDGMIVGNLSIIDKESLKKVKELNFENKVTFINKYKDLLIVSLHFHGFYVYKLTGDTDILTCAFKYIEVEKPRSSGTKEFQNCAVFKIGEHKLNIAFASYNNGISVYTYDLKKNSVTPHGELHPKTFPDMVGRIKGEKNTVFGLASKGNFVYGGLSTGNNRFRENFQHIDWARFDKRGIIYGPQDHLEEEHYHMELPEEDKPKFIGVIAGDPAPSFLCTAGDYLLFNLDKQGLGVAKIGPDNKLTYIGRALEDPEGRQLTYQLHFDGEFLYTSYRDLVENEKNPPVFRMYRLEN